MRQRLLFVYRFNYLAEVLPQYDKPGAVPTDFLYGMPAIDRERFDVRYINAPQGERKGIARRFFFPFEWVFSKLTRLGLPLEIFWLFRKEIRAADVVFGVNDPIGLSLLFWKRLGFIPGRVILIVQSAHERCREHFRFQAFTRRFVGWLLRGAAEVFLLAESAKAPMTEYFGVPQTRVHYFPFVGDHEFWTPVDVAREGYILSIGNDFNRDYRTVVQALLEHDRAVIITTKPVDTAGKNIELKKGLSNEEVRDAYRKARLTIIPSDPLVYESSGYSSAFQAVLTGTSLIVSDSPPMREVFTEKEHCLFYEPGNAASLREAIAYAKAHPEEMVAMAIRARERVIATHTAHHAAQAIERVIASPGSSPGQARVEKSHVTAITVLLFILAGALLFLNLGERSFWTDEWYAFKYFNLSFFEFIREYWQNPDNHPPGYYVILLAFVKLFGRHDIVVRLPSIFAGFGALFMTWRIARFTRERTDEQWPYFALALAATAPYLIILSQTARYFSLSAFLALIVTYAVLKIVVDARYHWLWWYAVALAATAYIDYPTALYVGIGSAVIILGYAIKKRAWRLLRLWLLAVIVVGVVAAPLVPIAFAEAQAEAAYGGDVLTSGPLAWLLRVGIYGYAALYGFVAFPWDWEITIPLALVAVLLIIAGFVDRGKRGHFWRKPAVLVVTIMGAMGLALNTALLSFLPRYTPLAYPRYASFALYLLFIVFAAFVWWITEKRRGIRFVILVLLLAPSMWLLFDKFGVVSADQTLFAADRMIYEEVRFQARSGDFIMINDDFPRVIFDWYREKYFANVTPIETSPDRAFFESGKRLWVIGYGYDDRDGFREPRQKAEDIAGPLGNAVQIIEKGPGWSIDPRLRAFKKRLTGHDTYEHKVGLFLITASDDRP